jgi:hypothetical protein
VALVLNKSCVNVMLSPTILEPNGYPHRQSSPRGATGTLVVPAKMASAAGEKYQTMNHGYTVIEM